MRIELSTFTKTVGLMMFLLADGSADRHLGPSSSYSRRNLYLVRRWRSATSGPTSTVGSRQSRGTAETHSTMASTTSWYRLWGARMRVCAMHASPLFMMALGQEHRDGLGGASSRRTAAALPPTLRVNRFSCRWSTISAWHR